LRFDGPKARDRKGWLVPNTPGRNKGTESQTVAKSIEHIWAEEIKWEKSGEGSQVWENSLSVAGRGKNRGEK